MEEKTERDEIQRDKRRRGLFSLEDKKPNIKQMFFSFRASS